MGYDDLDKFDSFEFVPNEDLVEAYFDSCKQIDADRPFLEREMIKRGLLGSC